YRGTSEPILDTKTEGDESEDEGPNLESEESEDEGPDSESEEAASEDQQQQAVPVEDTTVDEPLGLGYGATRRHDNEEYTIAITPVLPTEDPDNSLSMRDEHLSTIPETESDGLIKSSVENLVPIPSESEDFFDIKSECDVPVCDTFTTFSNLLFDADDDFSSSDDESFSDEDVSKEIYSNPLFDEEIISTKTDPHHFNFDSLLEEFSSELAHIDLIPPRINEADFDPEEDIRLVERLLYDNSSPRPLEEFNYDAIIESFSPSPIPVEDSNSFVDEIDLFLTTDDSMPPGIENGDYDSEGDILFLEELLRNDSPSLHENESFHFDVLSSPRPPAKPPDDDEIEPDARVFTKAVDDISDNSTRELIVHVPNVLPNLPTLSLMFDTFLSFSSENDDKVFNHGILASNEEKSPHLLSHRGFKAFQDISDFSESPMMIYGEDIPILDVLFLRFYPPWPAQVWGIEISPDFEASRAYGFVFRSLELQSFA
ncbi:hypothetical protein Tco_1442739, partial [Tanacetum coccineum]